MKALVVLLLALPCYGLAADTPWHNMPLVGSAHLSWFLWPVYDARLYARSDEFEFPHTRPFALQLQYRRAFTRQMLVDETRRQWRAIGIEENPAWLEQLSDILRDVETSDAITLYVDREGTSTFYFNDTALGRIADPAFSQAFAKIWLSEDSTRPDFRNALLGRNE